MKTPRLDALLRAVEARLLREGHGSKAALARAIGATKQQVQAWFSAAAKPNGEMTLALAEWHLRGTLAKKKSKRRAQGD